MLLIDASSNQRQLAEAACQADRASMLLTGVVDVPSAEIHLRCAKWIDTLPHVILADLENGTKRGVHLIAALRSSQAGKSIPLIAFTDQRGDGYIRSCLIAGASQCVPKPGNHADYREFLWSLRAYEPTGHHGMADGSMHGGHGSHGLRFG